MRFAYYTLRSQRDLARSRGESAISWRHVNGSGLEKRNGNAASGALLHPSHLLSFSTVLS
jgi:hypothetical protein